MNKLMSASSTSGKMSESAKGNESAATTLGLLEAIERNSQVTQRSIASELGIALGLANSYLKRCVNKGLVKVTQIPPNRYAYYLTPMGLSEKMRLTADYLTSGLSYYRKACANFTDLFDECAERGWTRVALYGVSELAEIGAITARERSAITLLGVVDPHSSREGVVGLPVRKSLTELGEVDAAILTAVENAQAGHEALLQLMPRERVLTPRLLRLSVLPPLES